MEKRGRKKKYTRVNRVQLIDLYKNQKLPVTLIEGLLDISYSTFRRALQFHDIPVRPKSDPWNDKLRKKHSVLLRRIHAKDRYQKMKNENVKTCPRDEGAKQKGRSVFT